MRTGRPRKEYSTVNHEKLQLSKNIVDALRSKGLSEDQLEALKTTIDTAFIKYQIEKQEELTEDGKKPAYIVNAEAISEFTQSKRVEGKSKETIYNYGRELEKMFSIIDKDYREITAQDIRQYLDHRKENDGVSNVTISNIRMYLMSFFKWALIEEKIYKNPMDRIGVIKKDKHVIQTLTDEEAEIIRCACENERDLAIVDLLSGSGMRVSELTRLNRQDVNFETGEVKVFGKGSKERICYLTGRAKVHLKWYLQARVDKNEALFVGAKKPYERLTKNGVEHILKMIAKKTGVSHLKLYPHKYRSTLATNMLNKGADITTIQHILGHSSPSVTSNHYAAARNDTIKHEYSRYVS